MMWRYRIKYYGGNQTEIQARGIAEAVEEASEQGRVVLVEELYDAD